MQGQNHIKFVNRQLTTSQLFLITTALQHDFCHVMCVQLQTQPPTAKVRDYVIGLLNSSLIKINFSKSCFT